MIFYKHGWMNGWITINVHGSCWTRWFHVFPNLRPRHRGPNLGTTTQVGIKNYPSGKLTWPWKILIFHGKYHQNWWMFHCYVGLQECRYIWHINEAEKHFKLECEIAFPTTAFRPRISLFKHGGNLHRFHPRAKFYVVFVLQESHEVIVRTAAVHRALWTMPGNFPIKETKNSFMDYVWNPSNTPFSTFCKSPGDCASLQLLNTLESLTFIPFLGKAESATRQQIGFRGMTWQLVIKSDDKYSKKSSNKCLGEGLTGKTSLLVTFTKKNAPEIFDSKHVSLWAPLRRLVRVRPFGNMMKRQLRSLHNFYR